MARGLTAITLSCYRRPLMALLGCGILLALSLMVGSQRLRIRGDWTYLFYPDDDIVVTGLYVRKAFPLPGDIVVLVDKGTPEQRQLFIDRLAARLKAEPETFYHVFHRLDLAGLSKKALFYLDEKTLRQMAEALNALKGEGSSQIGSMPTQGAGKQILLKLLDDLERALQSRGRASYIPIWETLAAEKGDQTSTYLGKILDGERYLYPTIGDGRINVLASKAGTYSQEFVNASPMIIRMRELLDELMPSSGELRIRLAGLPVMLHDERETVARDGARSTAISLVLVVMVFAVGFGEVKRPVLAVLALCCGLGWTVGFTTLVIGHLNFISVTLATMLMGIGIDFGIHFIFRYDEEMSNGLPAETAIEKTLAGTGVDTLVGATATAAAFLALTQAHFRGIADFGIIAAGGTLLCFLATITVLPALLALFPGKARVRKGPSAEVAWLERVLLKNARWVVLVWFLLIAASCFFATRIGFSYNLLEVQAQELSTIRTELEMIRETKSTVLSAESVDDSQQAARRHLAEYSALSSVARVSSILPLLPEISPGKQKLVDQIVATVRQVELPKRVRLESAEDLLALQQRLKGMEQAFPKESGDPEVERAIAELRQDIAGMEPGPIQDGLTAFQKEVRDDLSGTLAFLKQQTALAPNLDDMPPELRLRYVSQDGHYRQNVQPIKNIWQRENLEEFLGQVKAVDPRVMGHPVIQEAILSAFHRTLDRTPWFTLLGVLIVFTLYLRSPSAIVLSLLPAALAVLAIFAVMGFLGMDFNVVNFVGLPISVGLGAVYGVHSLHRMRELDDETVLTSSTGPALLLSGVTDIVGFASLMAAQHRGISSLGLVISVGIGVSFIASLILLPTLRRVFRQNARRAAGRSAPAKEQPQ